MAVFFNANIELKEANINTNTEIVLTKGVESNFKATCPANSQLNLRLVWSVLMKVGASRWQQSALPLWDTLVMGVTRSLTCNVEGMGFF